ncbi:hypothetical protein, partial [Aerococcus sp. HMSC061A03]
CVGSNPATPVEMTSSELVFFVSLFLLVISGSRIIRSSNFLILSRSGALKLIVSHEQASKANYGA